MSCRDLQTLHQRKTPLFILLVGLLVLSLMLIPQAGAAAKKNKTRSKAKTALKTKKRPAPHEQTRRTWIPDGALTPWLSVPPETLLQAQANEFLGTPYRPGGASKSGTDCSGLIKQIFSKVYGIELPHSSNALSQLPMMEKVAENELQPGDLIFFGPGGKRINHVGVYLADGKFLHASRKVGVTVSDLDENYWRKRLISYKRPQGLDAEADSPPPATGSMIATGEIVTAFGPHPADDRRHEWSTAYRRDLLTGSVDLSLGAFIETLDTAGQGLAYSSPDMDVIGPPAFSSDPQLRQGLRIASAIRPFDWLRITPSLSVVDRIDALSDQRGPLRVLAIEALMRPLDSRWTLAMATRTIASGNLSDSYDDRRSAADRNGSGAFDLSLGLRYDLSNDMSLALMGTHDSNRDDRWAATSAGKGESADDLSVRLNVRF